MSQRMNTSEAIAAAVNHLSGNLAETRRVLTDRALVLLVSAETGFSQETVKKFLRALERMPTTMLTAHGRSIRLREDDLL